MALVPQVRGDQPPGGAVIHGDAREGFLRKVVVQEHHRRALGLQLLEQIGVGGAGAVENGLDDDPVHPALAQLDQDLPLLAQVVLRLVQDDVVAPPVGDLVAAPGDAGEDVRAGMETDQADVHGKLAVLLDAEGADALLAAQPPLAGQGGERLANRAPGSLQLAAQLAFRGQLVAGHDLSVADILQYPLADLLLLPLLLSCMYSLIRHVLSIG